MCASIKTLHLLINFLQQIIAKIQYFDLEFQGHFKVMVKFGMVYLEVLFKKLLCMNNEIHTPLTFTNKCDLDLWAKFMGVGEVIACTGLGTNRQINRQTKWPLYSPHISIVGYYYNLVSARHNPDKFKHYCPIDLLKNKEFMLVQTN